MYELSVRCDFDAAHFLRGYAGKCENLHGHRFEVITTLKSEELDEIGISFDFTILKQILREILERLDHTCLNENPPFDVINPSSENIARTIYQEIQKKLTGFTVKISSITVYESPDSWVTYTP